MPALSSPTTTGNSTGASFVSPAALMAIKNLELRARIVVEGFWHGMHRSPYHGFSVEFTEYRAYAPGDDPRFLDWRLYARTDRYYLKKFEDETNLRCFLMVDNSHSMHFGTPGWTKSDYARTLAATLARFLHQQGDAVGLVTFDEQVRDWLPARNRPGHLRQIMLALERPAAGITTDLGPPLKRISELVRKRGLVVLLTDLLTPLATLETNLARITAGGHEVMLFHVVDPSELSFAFPQAAVFRDVESAQEIYLDPELARGDYQKRFAEHTAAARTICDKLGIGWRQAVTDKPLELALFDFLRERMQRGKLVRRKAAR